MSRRGRATTPPGAGSVPDLVNCVLGNRKERHDRPPHRRRSLPGLDTTGRAARPGAHGPHQGTARRALRSVVGETARPEEWCARARSDRCGVPRSVHCRTSWRPRSSRMRTRRRTSDARRPARRRQCLCVLGRAVHARGALVRFVSAGPAAPVDASQKDPDRICAARGAGVVLPQRGTAAPIAEPRESTPHPNRAESRRCAWHSHCSFGIPA